MTGPSEWLVDRMCAIAPERRRLVAARMTLFSAVTWPVSHIVIELVPGRVFQHIMVAVSFVTWIVGNLGIITTEDVKVDTAEKGGP